TVLPKLLSVPPHRAATVPLHPFSSVEPSPQAIAWRSHGKDQPAQVADCVLHGTVRGLPVADRAIVIPDGYRDLCHWVTPSMHGAGEIAGPRTPRMQLDWLGGCRGALRIAVAVRVSRQCDRAEHTARIRQVHAPLGVLLPTGIETIEKEGFAPPRW